MIAMTMKLHEVNAFHRPSFLVFTEDPSLAVLALR